MIFYMPQPGPNVSAVLVYSLGCSEPLLAFITGVNGQYQITIAQWRTMQMVQRSGSRFL